MKLVCAAVLAIGCVAAHADSQADFLMGRGANLAGYPDKAITFYTKAIDAGDLKPTDLPDAYSGRGEAYLKTNRCKDALPDFDKAIELKPLLPYYDLRASAKLCLGDLDGAVSDAGAAIAIRRDDSILAFRGNVRWVQGRFAQSAEDYAESAKHPSRFTRFSLLWYAISATRAGTFQPQELAAMALANPKGYWPEALIEFYLGKMSVDDVRHASDAADPRFTLLRKCPMDFYIGEWKLLHGEPAAAKPLLESAAAACPANLVERESAAIELKRSTF